MNILGHPSQHKMSFSGLYCPPITHESFVFIAAHFSLYPSSSAVSHMSDIIRTEAGGSALLSLFVLQFNSFMLILALVKTRAVKLESE